MREMNLELCILHMFEENFLLCAAYIILAIHSTNDRSYHQISVSYLFLPRMIMSGHTNKLVLASETIYVNLRCFIKFVLIRNSLLCFRVCV